jgi:7-cyano-7-deazaguanine synthase
MNNGINKDKCLVLFSGGQDSTTCLLEAVKTHKEVVAVSVNYGQRHAEELNCASRIAKELGVEHHILDMSLLNQLAPNALTRTDMVVDTKAEDGALPNTFVEGRNLLFLSFVAVMAKTKGISKIITGVSQSDFSGYPDCRDSFIKSLNVTLNLAMDYEFVLETPLMWLTKEETWAMADRLDGLDFIRYKTLTCYNGVIGDGCGECPACHLRKRGLDAYLTSKK